MRFLAAAEAIEAKSMSPEVMTLEAILIMAEVSQIASDCRRSPQIAADCRRLPKMTFR